MSNLKLTLDTRRAKKDGTYPIVFRITINGESRDISTGYSSNVLEWNNNTHQLKKNHPRFHIVNTYLKELEVIYLGRLLEYEKTKNGNFNIQEVKNYLLSKQLSTLMVYQFWFEEVERLKKINRHGAARVSKCALDVLHKVKSLEVPFDKVDFTYLSDAETILSERDVKANSISVYFRSLRAIYNRAINMRVANLSHYPFKAYRIKKEPTVPRPLSLEEIQKYFRLQIEVDSLYYKSWLIGKLIFLLAGINVTDLLQLTSQNVKAGRVIYLRSKTKRLYSVKVLIATEVLLNSFHSTDNTTLIGYLTFEQINNKTRLPFVIQQKIMRSCRVDLVKRIHYFKTKTKFTIKFNNRK